MIVTGSWLTVKEQMPELYARRFAERPKRLNWTEGSQTDFYDQQPHVDAAVEAADVVLKGAGS